MKNPRETLSDVKGEAGESASMKFQGGFEKEPWIFNNYHCLSNT
jgi:hypothetical protein